jgi:hypothetical protein
LALAAAGAAIKLVMRLPAPLKAIGDQVIRSAAQTAIDVFDHVRAMTWRLLDPKG